MNEPLDFCVVLQTFAKLIRLIVQVIKNRIEDLIAREYIERDAENGDTYR
jgi:hypothetical protein